MGGEGEQHLGNPGGTNVLLEVFLTATKMILIAQSHGHHEAQWLVFTLGAVRLLPCFTGREPGGGGEPCSHLAGERRGLATPLRMESRTCSVKTLRLSTSLSLTQMLRKAFSPGTGVARVVGLEGLVWKVHLGTYTPHCSTHSGI